MKKIAYQINNIEEYGKLMKFCIDNDICVYRTYYEEGKYYTIDLDYKRCYLIKIKSER